MIGLFRSGSLSIYRPTSAGWEHCWTVTGTDQELLEGWKAAQFVRELAIEAGEWEDPGSFRFNPLEPVPRPGIRRGRLTQNDGDGFLGEL